MPEKPTSPEQHETQIPNQLDIVKINGRWAQIGGMSNNITRYLDDNSTEEVNWDDFNFERIGLSVFDAIDVRGEIFTDTETDNIHWGPEEIKNPDLKMEVWVFGEYTKK
jgi:hypothetical protein